MKMLPLLLITATLALFAEVGYAQTAQEVLTEAQRAYLRGDKDTAKAKFKLVLELDPRNTTAQNYMHMIQVQEKANTGSGAEREKQLAGVVLPRVELKDASFETTLDYLKQSAAKQGRNDISFVVQVPPEVAEAKKVTLNLSNIPFTEVLRYVGELTGFKFSIDKYAIVVKQAQTETAAAASPSVAP